MDSYIFRAEHEEFAKRMQDEHVRLNKRLGIAEADIDKLHMLHVSIEKMATNMQCMLDEQKKQGKRLEALEGVPKKNADAFKFAIIGSIGTALGGSIVALLMNFM